MTFLDKIQYLKVKKHYRYPSVKIIKFYNNLYKYINILKTVRKCFDIFWADFILKCKHRHAF